MNSILPASTIKKALLIKPDLVATRLNLANLYVVQQSYDKAVP